MGKQNDRKVDVETQFVSSVELLSRWEKNRNWRLRYFSSSFGVGTTLDNGRPDAWLLQHLFLVPVISPLTQVTYETAIYTERRSTKDHCKVL